METIQDICDTSDVQDIDMWTVMNEMRMSTILCDTIIISEDETQFFAHKIVLAAHSPIFEELMTNEDCDKENTKEKEIRKLHLSMDSEVVNALMGHIYTPHPSLSTSNVLRVYEAANSLLMSDLMSECISFIKGNLDADNYLSFYEYANTNKVAELKQACKVFMMRNFHSLVSNSDLLQKLQFVDLKELLSDDLLNVNSEEDLFEVVMGWISHEPDKRSSHSLDLLTEVRFGMIQADYFLQKVTNHPHIIKQKPACHVLLTSAWKYICTQEKSGSRQLHLKHPQIRPRIPHAVIFILGGWSGGTPISSIEVYDSKADKWYSQPAISRDFPRAYHGLVALNNKMYLLGGFDGSKYFRSVTCYDPVKCEWNEVGPMYNQRCYVSTTTADGCIYACGGFDGRTRLRTAERYDPHTNQWTLLSKMTYRRSDAGATTLNGKVYIAGGFNGENCLRSVEVYDPRSDQWSELTGTNSVRSGLGLCTYKQQIYALGGFDGERRLRTVERYNENSRKWEAVAKMHLPRSNFSAVTFEDRLFVIGGFNGSRTIRSSEYFDMETNEWHDVSNININRSAFQACVISDIPNVTDYTFHGKSLQ